MFAAIIIITLLFLIVLLLLLPRSVPRSEPAIYVIGRDFDESVWPASYWNWFGGYGGWGSRPEYRWTAGPGYKPAGNWGPRYGDRVHHRTHLK